MFKLQVLLAVLVCISAANHFQTTITLSDIGAGQGWVYLNKIKFQPSIARIVFETWTTGNVQTTNTQIMIQAIPESAWSQEKQNKCKNPMSMPVMVLNINLKQKKYQNVFQFGLSKPQTYYLVLRDCRNRMQKDYQNFQATMTFRFKAFNNEQPITPQEQQQL